MMVHYRVQSTESVKTMTTNTAKFLVIYTHGDFELARYHLKDGHDALEAVEALEDLTKEQEDDVVTMQMEIYDEHGKRVT